MPVSRQVASLLALISYCCVFTPDAQAQTPDTGRTTAEPFFTVRDAYRAGGFAVTMFGLAFFDKRLAQGFQEPEHQESSALQNTASAFRFMGGPAPHIIAPTLYVVGKLTHHQRMAALGLHSFEAIFLGTAITGITKITVGRARPYVLNDSNSFNFGFLRGREGAGFQSFPSGHTTAAFAFAAAVSAETSQWINEKNGPGYLKILIGGTLYGCATLVGLSRMYNNKHWATDVVGGAAVGTFSGIKVVHYSYRNPKNRIERALLGLQVAPGPDGSAVLFYSVGAPR